MFPKWLRNILKYFSLWSFHSVPFVKIGGTITTNVVLIFHIGLCAWCSFCAYREFIRKQALMEFIDVLNFFLYYITSASLYWFIIYDSYTKKREQQLFWETYGRANKRLRSKLNLEKGKYLTVMILLIIADVFVCAIALIREIKTDFGRIMHFTLLTVFDHRICFYFLHLKVIAFHLKEIQAQIKAITARNSNVLSMQRLHLIRDQYKLVYEMSDSVNRIFGISHLILIMLSFHSSVTFLNFSYRIFHGKFQKYHNGLLFLYIGRWILSTIFIM